MDPISDAEVCALFNSDTRLLQSRLGLYVDFCSRQTDAPLVYHVMVGLGLLASLAPANLRYFTHGNRLRAPQVWAVLLGRSTADRKSTSIRLGHALLLELAPERDAGPPAGSAEAMIDNFARCPLQTMVFSEFSSFLELTAKPMYAQMRNILIQAYDGERLGRNLVGNSAGAEGEVRSNIIAGLSFGYYDDLISESTATGGFLARLGQVIGRREGPDRPEAPPDPERYQVLLQRLRDFRDLDMAPEAHNVGMSPDATATWAAFIQETDRWMHGQKDAVVAAIGRARELARNVAVLCALDLGAVNLHRPWMLTDLATRVGITVGTWVIRSATQMLTNLADTRFRRDRRALINLFRDRPAMTHQALSAGMLVDQRYLALLIQALIAEGRLGKTSALTDRDALYFLRSVAQAEAETPEVSPERLATLVGQGLPPGHSYTVQVAPTVVVQPATHEGAAALAAQDTTQAVGVVEPALPSPTDLAKRIFGENPPSTLDYN